MATVILECDYYTNVHVLNPEIPPFKTKKIELDKLKDFIEDAFKDEELMSKTKRASAMDYSIRGKESGKKFGNKKEIHSNPLQEHSVFFEVAPYWNEIKENDFTIVCGNIISMAQFKLEIDGNYTPREWKFDANNGKVLYNQKELFLMDKKDWETDDWPRFDYEGILGDDKCISIFKKDKSGFPIYLTDIK